MLLNNIIIYTLINALSLEGRMKSETQKIIWYSEDKYKTESDMRKDRIFILKMNYYWR